MSAKETGKAIGALAAWAVFIVATGLLLVLTIRGAAWVSDKVLPVLNLIVLYSLIGVAVLGLPFLFSRKTRGYVGLALLLWSYLCGADLWMFSLLVCLNLWGVFAAIVGLFIAGIGVVPVAILATIFKAQWFTLFSILVLGAFLIAARIGSRLLLGKSVMSEEV